MKRTGLISLRDFLQRSNSLRAFIVSAIIGMTPTDLADATISTTTFGVSAVVLNVCAVTASPLAFGNYTASSGSPTPATNTIAVTCTPGLNYTISLNAGTTSGATVAARLMANGANTMSYGLYTSNSYATIWGDGTLGTSTVASQGTGSQQSFTDYGLIPALQYVASGNYSDTITVTVTY